MNKVILVGRLCKDPDIRNAQGGNAMTIARFSLAVNRRFKREGQPDADFINCVAFGKTGEFIEKYCKKGTKLVVEGRIQTGSYTNRDGQKIYTTDVIVEAVEFAESKSNNNGSNSTSGHQTSNPPSQSSQGNFMDIPDTIDEELPFN